MSPMRPWLAFLALFAFAPACAEDDSTPELMVFAAASLTDVLGEIASRWERTSRVPLKFSFAASSVLARQIEAGGRADVFLSADREWVDYLDARHLIRGASRRDLAGNRLVLIAPADSDLRLTMRPGIDLSAFLGSGRLSVADPDTVPAGRYAREALTHLRAWDAVASRLVRVYATDAQIDPKVRVIATFPDHSHAPITYPAAATADAGPQAEAFLDFLASPEALGVWKKHGFLELHRR
jgi:molybdate transport system substrate-binding protein